MSGGSLVFTLWTISHLKATIKMSEKARKYIEKNFKKKNNLLVFEDAAIEIKNDCFEIFTTHKSFEKHFIQLL